MATRVRVFTKSDPIVSQVRAASIGSSLAEGTLWQIELAHRGGEAKSMVDASILGAGPDATREPDAPLRGNAKSLHFYAA